MLAAMVSSLMSSLASVFNSCATLYTMDLYLPRYPRATPKELVKVGRMTVGGPAHSARQTASHSLTHSLIHSFTHSLTHSFTHSLSHWPVSQPASKSVSPYFICAVHVRVVLFCLAAVAVLSVAWLPMIPLFGDQLFTYIQKPPGG
jgi:hypothetical protein